MSRNYPRLDIYTFGKHLLRTNDLDPIYVALHAAGEQWGPEQQARWMVAYWCLYHAGQASYLSEFEGREFWDKLLIAAKNEEPTPCECRWQRGHERRHWRGEAAIRSLFSIREKFVLKPEAFAYQFAGGGEYAEFAKKVKQYHLFGNWIAFKIADMLERICAVPIDFSEAAVFMFKDPTEAALRFWRVTQGLPDNAQPKSKAAQDEIIHQVVAHLEEMFDGWEAPPRYERAVGLTEVETILCKWKSHLNGHYPPYNDTKEIHAGLEPWLEHSKAARDFKAAMPENTDAMEW